MKRKIILLVSLVLGCTQIFAQGIDFFHGTLDEALQKAKLENKLVFVDCYTSWCGPCKMLQRNTFPDEKVGDYFNMNFVSVKFDCEKENGPEVCRKYNVRAYPTLLFLDVDGKVLQTTMGYRPPESLLAEAQKVGLSGGVNVDEMTRKYQSGNYDNAFLKDYLNVLTLTNKDNTEVFEKYLSSQTAQDLLNNDNTTLIMKATNSITSPGMNEIFKNKNLYIDKFGADAFNSKMNGLINKAVSQAAQKNDKKLYDQAMRTLKMFKLPDAAKTKTESDMLFAKSTGNLGQYVQLAGKYLKKYYPKDASKYSEIASALEKTTDDVSLLNSALGFAKKAVAIDNKALFNKTLAEVYLKQGNLADANAYANLAFEKAKEEQLRLADYQLLIRKIEDLRKQQTK